MTASGSACSTRSCVRCGPMYRTMPMPDFAAAHEPSTAAPGYRVDPVTRPTTPRVYFISRTEGTRIEEDARSASIISAAGSASSISNPKSTSVTLPQAYDAGGSMAQGLRAPNITVRSAGRHGPGIVPSSTPIPEGVSTARISGRSFSWVCAVRASGPPSGLHESSSAEASVAAIPCNAPETPIPVIASTIRSA